MLQLAQATATLANGGVRHKPQLVVASVDPATGARVPLAPEPAVDLGYKPQHVAAVRRAMVGVTQGGTSTRVFAGAGYLSGGKTGTAQAVGIAQNARYNAARLDERKRDHALYIAFAPADEPRIALALIVENAGFGAAHAAPIARRVFDYWLLGQYPNEQDLAAVRAGRAAAPLGKPLRAADVPGPGEMPAQPATPAEPAVASAPLPKPVPSGAAGPKPRRAPALRTSGAAAL